MRFTRPWMIDRFGRLIQRTIAKNWWNQLYSVRWASKFQHIVGLQSKAGQPTAVTGNNFFTCRRRRRRKNPVRRSCTAELVPTLGAAGFFRAARTDRFLWPSDQSALGDVALRSAPARRRSRPRQYHQLRFHRLPPSPLARFGSICSPPSPSASSRFRIFFISTSASSFSWRSANLLAVDVVQLLLAKGAVFFFGYLAV
ncbi:Error-prone DNA polymerase [Trichinella pseudospiralis]